MFQILMKLMGAKKPKPDLLPFTKFKDIADAEAVQRRELRNWLDKQEPSRRLKLLDVGGGDGKKVDEFLGEYADCFDVYVLDIEDAAARNHIIMDITHICPEQYLAYFDAVYSYNAFEHFRDPLVASDNVSKMLRSDGLCLIHTVFSWRYHPVPKDYYRFTDDALRYMFSERNSQECLACGYDISRRRENITGGFFGERDVPPLDHYGGFRENWGVYYVGLKK